jgi:hypothetical protein
MNNVDFYLLLLQEQEEMRGAAAASTHADATKDPSSAQLLISYRRLRGHWMPSYQR